MGVTMRHGTRVILFTLTALFIGTAGAAMAADCSTLQQLASIPLTSNGDAMLVPVSINEQPRFLLLDTGGSITQLTAATAQDLDLPVMNSDIQLFDIDGHESHLGTRVRHFAIGNLNARNISFPLNPAPSFGDKIAGLLSLDLFTAYDVDVDFANARMGYFSQDHCPGKVVYWDEDALTIIPMTLHDHHITIPVTLDGQKMDAIIDTGSNHTIMSLQTARHFFNLSPDAPGLDISGTLGDNPDRKTYAKKFGILSFGGVSVSNLDVTLVPDIVGKGADHTFESETLNRASDNIHLPQLVIGMNVLKHLHIYFAFKEKNIYITPASAGANAAAEHPK